MSVGYSEEESEQIQQEVDPYAGGIPVPPPDPEPTWIQKVHDQGISPATIAQWEAYHAEIEAANALYEAQQAEIAAGKLIPGTIPTYADPGIQAEYETDVVPASEQTIYYRPPESPDYSIAELITEREFNPRSVIAQDESYDEEDIQAYQEYIQSIEPSPYEKRLRADYTTGIPITEIITEREFNPQSVIAQELGEAAVSSPEYQAYLAARMEQVAANIEARKPMSESDKMEIREFGERDFYDPITGEFPHTEMWGGLEQSDEYGLLGGTTAPSLTWAGNPLEWAKAQQDPADWPLEKYFQPQISDDFYMDKSFTEYATVAFNPIDYLIDEFPTWIRGPWNMRQEKTVIGLETG